MLLIDKNQLKRILGLTVYRRAQDYYKRQMILEFNADEDGIDAIVEGSGAWTYEVGITFSSTGGIQEAYCSCPYLYICRHIGAVLLKGIDEISKNIPVEESEQIFPLKNNGRLNCVFVRKLKLIQDQSLEEKPTNKANQRHKLIFIIENTYHGYRRKPIGWIISPVLRYIKKDGRPGQWRLFNRERLTEPVSDDENNLLSMLLEKENKQDFFDNYIDFLLKKPDINLFIKRRVNLIRAKLISVSKAVIRFQFAGMIDTAPVFSPVFDFYDDNSLKASLEPPPQAWAKGFMFYIIDEEMGYIIYRYNDIVFQKILTDLVRETELLTFSDIHFLSDYIEKCGTSSLHVDFTARQVRILHRKPVPILELDGSVDTLRLNLLFNYEGRIFPFQRQEIFLRLQNDDNDNGEYLAAARNKMYEKSCFLLLTSLMAEKSILRYAEHNQYAPYLLILSNGLDHFLINYGQKLLDKGFELRRKGKRIRSIDRLSITISKNMDWLDMNIEMVDEKGTIYSVPGRTVGCRV